VDARYAVYFDKEDPARRAWSAYRGAVYNYISMRCCDEFIDEDVKNLRAYAAGLAKRPFKGSRDPWEILRCGDDRRCASASEFAEAHKWAGLALLRRRGTVLDKLRVAQPEGFSSGWGTSWTTRSRWRATMSNQVARYARAHQLTTCRGRSARTTGNSSPRWTGPLESKGERDSSGVGLGKQRAFHLPWRARQGQP
jgi:hypothetical protein